jgi:RNase adapter protein RapZ
VTVQGPARNVQLTVISGLSGAGRSEAAKAFEDLGWFVIDNLPPALIDKMLSLALAPAHGIERIALVIDARGESFFGDAARELERLRGAVGKFRLVFLEASDDVLVRRFETSRRRHPLATGDRMVVGIQRERELMRPLRGAADLLIDTSDQSVRALRKRIAAYFEGGALAEGPTTTVVSFGYKFGLPLDADIVLDVRFLPNPYWVDELRDLTGHDREVRDYVMRQEGTTDFLERARDLFTVWLPGFREEGRHYLTVAVGCTGGRHRSVVLAEAISDFIAEKGFSVKVIHRDLGRSIAS